MSRKPRLSEMTVRTLYNVGKANTGMYEYEIETRWNDEYKAYEDILTRWDGNLNYEEWVIPAEGIWAFEKKEKRPKREKW